MPTLEENKKYWSDYTWSEGGDEWSEVWGGTPSLWWGSLFPRLHPYLPAPSILEIAPGFGRFTQFLKDFTDRLAVVDVTERCIEACRKRFADAEHIDFHVNDGYSLAMIEDDSVDFAFSFDSLVHAEADVLESYVRQLGTKLRREGVAFIHHSHLAAHADPETGALPFDNRHWRAPSMSGDLMVSYAREAGLSVIGQELVNWGGEPLTDCFSLLTRAGSRYDRPREVRENPRFMDEATSLAEVARLYRIGGPEGA